MGNVTLLNIYAPNEVKERCALWEILKLTLLTNYRWVMAKDFHIMEVEMDKFLMCGKRI
jgi:hypothetical protein